MVKKFLIRSRPLSLLRPTPGISGQGYSNSSFPQHPSLLHHTPTNGAHCPAGGTQTPATWPTRVQPGHSLLLNQQPQHISPPSDSSLTVDTKLPISTGPLSLFPPAPGVQPLMNSECHALHVKQELIDQGHDNTSVVPPHVQQHPSLLNPDGHSISYLDMLTGPDEDIPESVYDEFGRISI
jgi:hypothetical protein